MLKPKKRPARPKKVPAAADWRESETRYRDVFDTVPLAIFVCDREGVIQNYNRRAVELWGREPECGIEKYCGSASLMLPDGSKLPHAQSPITEVLRTGKPALNVELFVQRPDGSRIAVVANFAALQGAQGEITGAITSILDITGHKRAEEAVRENEERYRVLISIITDVPWTTDPLGRFVTPQSAWAAYTGQTWEEHRDFGWANALHSGDRERIYGEWEQARDRRVLYQSEGRLWHAPTQQARYFIVKAAPRLNPDGTVREWVGTCTDIHNQKLAEQAALAAAERFRFMAESMPQKIFTARTNGDVDYFNQQWTEFTGLSFEQIRNWGWTQFIHPEDVQENVRRWQHSLATGEPFRFEHRFRRADGTYRWHLSRAHAMRDTAGAIIMWIGSNTDIDDQKQAEAGLAQRVEEETAAVRQLSLRLLNLQDEEHRSISRELHDSIGQHLASVKMTVDRLRQVESPGKQTELLSQVSQTLDDCMSETRTISHLLHPPLIEELGFPAAAKWYVQGFSERSGIKVNFDISDDPRRLSRSLELALFRVLQASLSNVHRHAQSPSVDVRFDLTAAEASLEVKDYGRGISRELLERFQLTGTESGIGLAGMRERIGELGGRLEIESGSGGTTIRAVIPLAATTKTSTLGKNE